MYTLRVTKASSHKLQSRFCWVYRNEIAACDAAIQNGEIVRIESHGGAFFGVGYYNAHSEITVRILSFEERNIDAAFIARRIERAVHKRAAMREHSDAYRIVHAEADMLPGLMADYYNGYLSLQINTLGMERLRTWVIDALVVLLKPKGIIEKSDPKMRRKEGLEPAGGVIWGEVPQRVVMQERGVAFEVDLHAGQKTGFYLDQRRNRHVVSGYVRSGMRVLDCFCNAGGFGLHALREGASVHFVDMSDSALSQVERNLTCNGFAPQKITKADAFDFMESQVASATRYDLIVLDPPPFAKSKREVEGAMKGMGFLLASAIKLLDDQGIVALFSCSHHVGIGELLTLALHVGMQEGVMLEVLELLRADADHPYILSIPNTDYLSGVVLRTVAV